MGLAEVRRIFNTKPLTSLATCYISYPLPGKFWGIFGNLPAVLFIQNWLLLKTGCFYSASPDWWLWAGKHSNGWHSIKLSYKKNYCLNIAKGTSECNMARCYYLESSNVLDAYKTHCIDAWLLLGISIKASPTGEMVLPPLTVFFRCRHISLFSENCWRN